MGLIVAQRLDLMGFESFVYGGRTTRIGISKNEEKSDKFGRNTVVVSQKWIH